MSNPEFEKQIANCDHVPFSHDLLSDRFVCLCGKVRAEVPSNCPCLRCKARREENR